MRLATIFQIGVIALAVIGVAHLGIGIYDRWTGPKPGAPFVAQPQARPTAGVTEVTLPVQKIIIYQKEEVAKRVPLPPSISDNPDKEITASATVKPSEHTTTVLSVLDKETGKSEIFTRKEPLPFYELSMKGRIGTRYLYTNLSEAQVVTFAEMEVLRVSSAHISLYGESGLTVAGRRPGSDVSYWKAGVQLHYNFDLVDVWKSLVK